MKRLIKLPWTGFVYITGLTYMILLGGVSRLTMKIENEVYRQASSGYESIPDDAPIEEFVASCLLYSASPAMIGNMSTVSWIVLRWQYLSSSDREGLRHILAEWSNCGIFEHITSGLKSSTINLATTLKQATNNYAAYLILREMGDRLSGMMRNRLTDDDIHDKYKFTVSSLELAHYPTAVGDEDIVIDVTVNGDDVFVYIGGMGVQYRLDGYVVGFLSELKLINNNSIFKNV